MKCSHSSTLVPKCSQAFCIKKLEGFISIKKKILIAVNVSKRDWTHTHTEPLQWGSDSSAWEENPKRCGVRRPIRGRNREKTFQKDHHRLHTDRHGLPSDRLCYSEMKEVGDEEGMEKECEKTKEHIWKQSKHWINMQNICKVTPFP